MRFIFLLLICQFTFGAKVTTTECIERVQDFLSLSDNEAVSMTGYGHRSKECFLDVFTRKEIGEEERESAELVFLQEVKGKKRGLTEVRLMSSDESFLTKVRKCRASENQFLLRFDQVEKETRQRVSYKVKLKKNNDDKIVRAKLMKLRSRYNLNPANSRTKCRF